MSKATAGVERWIRDAQGMYIGAFVYFQTEGEDDGCVKCDGAMGFEMGGGGPLGNEIPQTIDWVTMFWQSDNTEADRDQHCWVGGQIAPNHDRTWYISTDTPRTGKYCAVIDSRSDARDMHPMCGVFEDGHLHTGRITPGQKVTVSAWFNPPVGWINVYWWGPAWNWVDTGPNKAIPNIGYPWPQEYRENVGDFYAPPGAAYFDVVIRCPAAISPVLRVDDVSWSVS